MSRRLARCVFTAAWLAATAVLAAQPFGPEALQKLLQDAPRRAVHFTELRESPWLDVPAQSSGTLEWTAGVLVKRIDKPRRETWRILDDRLQVLVDGAAAPKEIRFADLPALAALARALRGTLAGDLHGLGRDFQLVLSGDASQWAVRLTPRRSEVAQYMKQLDLRGTRGQLLTIEILEGRGERTTTTLLHDTQ